MHDRVAGERIPESSASQEELTQDSSFEVLPEETASNPEAFGANISDGDDEPQDDPTDAEEEAETEETPKKVQERGLFDDDEEVESRDLFGDNGDSVEEFEDDGDEVDSGGGYQFEPDELDETREYVSLPIGQPPPQPGPSEELWMLGLPLNVGITHEYFDSATMSAREESALKENNAKEKKVLKQLLGQDAIRVMQKPEGGVTSNTRLVQFSDGSSALVVGNKVYEADARSDGSTILLETSQKPLYHVHGILKQKRIFKPPSVAALEGKSIRTGVQKVSQLSNKSSFVLQRTRLTTVQEGAESELRLKRHMEEMALKEQENERKSRKRKTQALDAGFLESD